MGLELGTGLAIAQVGLGVANAVAQLGVAHSSAAGTKAAAHRQTQASYKEIGRQQTEVNRIASEQTSDRIRAANSDLASVRMAAMERGVSGTTMGALVREVGYLEGADLRRIEQKRVANIEAGEAAKASAKNGYLESVTIADNQLAVATTGALLGAVGSGLSIGTNYFQQQQYLSTLQNKVS